MKNKPLYDRYRGRSPLRTALKILVVLLALVLAFCIAGLFLLEPYWVHTADGAQLRLPWLSNPAPSPSPVESVPAPSSSLVIVTPEVTARPSTIHAVTLPAEALYDGTAIQRLRDAGGNAALFQMKGDDGTLAFFSDQPLAAAAGVNAADGSINAAIAALNEQDGLYTIARISCFRDNALSDADYNLNILTNSGYRWKDPDGIRWVSPTNESVQAYLLGLCRELAALGFDEILLDYATFPPEGNLHYIKVGPAYQPEALSTVIDAFYAQVRQALEDYPDTTLSISTSAATLAGEDVAASGQTLTGLVANANRIWSPDLAASWAACVQRLTQAGFAHPEVNLVTQLTHPGAEERSWALP